MATIYRNINGSWTMLSAKVAAGSDEAGDMDSFVFEENTSDSSPSGRLYVATDVGVFINGDFDGKDDLAMYQSDTLADGLLLPAVYDDGLYQPAADDAASSLGSSMGF